jgi:cytidylate kinase
MSTGLIQGYIEAQARRSPRRRKTGLPVITISREAGAGAVTIGELVAKRLNVQSKGADTCPWTVFDRNLVKRVLEDHELPARIKEFMPEDTVFNLRDAVEELLGLHPANWTLVQHTTDTILRLAHLGNAIVVGRGANIITANMPTALHVRLVAPLVARIEHAARFYRLNMKEAAQFVAKTDRARARYVKRHFNARINDPLQYHLTINTGQVPFEEAARIIAEAVPKPHS